MWIFLFNVITALEKEALQTLDTPIPKSHTLTICTSVYNRKIDLPMDSSDEIIWVILVCSSVKIWHPTLQVF